MDIQSSRPHFPTVLKFVTRRRITSEPLIIVKVKPTMKMAGARVGGSRKFGGSPFGLRAKGVLEGSTLGGRDAIAAVNNTKRQREIRPWRRCDG